MAITKQEEAVRAAKRERPRTSDIKQLFERYRRASRRLDDATRSGATRVTAAPGSKTAPSPPTKS
jgi:hypothetical protein